MDNKLNGGTTISLEEDADLAEPGKLLPAISQQEKNNSKISNTSDRIKGAPVIDLVGDTKLANKQSAEQVTETLVPSPERDEEEEGQECLEGMPVLTLEVSPEEDEFEENNGNGSIETAAMINPITEDNSAKSKDNRANENSFQKSYDADMEDSVTTPNLRAVGLKTPSSAQLDSSGDADMEVSRNTEEDGKQSTSDDTMNVDTADSPADTESPAASNSKERRKRKPRSELDRLLMDEGTVRILLGQPKADTSRGSGSSRKDKMNELAKKRDMVINQVRDSSRTKLFNKVSLRVKTKTKRQQSEEKRNGGKKSKITTEPASKIIRRRSSSCSFNFSSRSPSPLPMNAPLQSSPQDSIQVRVQNGVGYICIDSEAVIFNTQVASRLNSILNSFNLDESITVVELTTTSDFIQGLDIEGIRGETDDSLRESMADSMIACLDTLLKTLIKYPKLLVAGVRGEALDFGVLILSYFDIVYASDKATFRTNYGNNGYLPECLQFFPKNRLTHAMLYTGKKLSASEAATSGLITEVLPTNKFSEELENRIKYMAASNQQVLLQTKAEVNTKKSNKLELTRDLRSSWLRF